MDIGGSNGGGGDPYFEGRPSEATQTEVLFLDWNACLGCLFSICVLIDLVT
jgi:hypothetical protein